MEFLNEKNMIVDGVDKYYVSELKRVYGLSLIHISSPRDRQKSRMPSSA